MLLVLGPLPHRGNKSMMKASAAQVLPGRHQQACCSFAHPSGAGARVAPRHQQQQQPQHQQRQLCCTSTDVPTHPTYSRLQQLHDIVTLASRRTVVAGILPVVAYAAAAGPAQAARLQQDPRLRPLQVFWQQLVAHLQQQLSEDFAPNLVFYGAAEVLPTGTPGDPAAEYNKKAARACGPLTSGFQQPYATCPGVPGAVADSDTARDCCRHFAFAVPRSRYAFAALDRQTSVVASPRLALAAADNWQGILTHEMGHCIDFWVFGQARYQLPAERAPKSAAAAAALAAIDAVESDAELRADCMANALLMPLLGQKLCYDSRTRVQALVPLPTQCAADEPGSSESASQLVYMQHFPHPPVSRVP